MKEKAAINEDFRRTSKPWVLQLRAPPFVEIITFTRSLINHDESLEAATLLLPQGENETQEK